MSDSRSKGTTGWRDEPSETPLLSATDVVVDYPVKGWRAAPFRALKGVSIVIHQGETLGLVGESGSGKTTLGRAILGLAPVTEGSIHHRGRPIHQLDRRARRSLSKELQVVFQDPYSSLNPSLPIGDILTEPLLIEGASKEQARERVAELLEHVHLPKDAVSRLPREFSGGQRQRIAIARALCRQPRLIVCDEPVSALDLSTQARVLDLLIELQERLGVSFLFISHDLTVVRYIAHRTAVMLEGEIVEEGDTATVTSTPKHTYTERLLLAAPVADPERQAERRTRRQQFAAAHGGTRSS